MGATILSHSKKRWMACPCESCLIRFDFSLAFGECWDILSIYLRKVHGHLHSTLHIYSLWDNNTVKIAILLDDNQMRARLK